MTEEALAAWARLVRASRALLDAVEADIKRAGLPPLAWYDALLELRRAGDGGLRPIELQQAMLLAQYNLSRLVDRLEMAGYVERRACLQDRRGQRVTITDRGLELLTLMWPVYREAVHRHFAGRLAPLELEMLAQLLGKLLERHEPSTHQTTVDIR